MLCHGIKWIPNIWELLHAGDLHMPWPKIIRKRIIVKLGLISKLFLILSKIY